MSKPEPRTTSMTRDPHPKAPGTSVGIDEPMIQLLVHTFYAFVRADPLLGPVFNRSILDWDAHLDKLCAFWSSVTLTTGRQGHADEGACRAARDHTSALRALA
jgi:truncated hemoglobin YjbI